MPEANVARELKIAVISAFGRGNWMAAELAEKGFSCQLIDVTDHMGRWTPEDWEGPFGVLQSESLVRSQITRLMEEDYHDELPDGMTFWLADGPIDTRGLLVQNWLEKMPAYSLAKRYVEDYDKAESTSGLDDLQERLYLQGFEKSWLAHLSHQLASPEFQMNALGLNSGRPLPIFSPFHLRRVTRKGLQKSLDWCRAKGVEVVSPAKVVDIAIEGKTCTGVQISGEASRVVVADKYVWCLSSEEIQRLSTSAGAVLFPKGPLQPQWCWMRWRFRTNLDSFARTLPAHFVFINDLDLPWTHTNLLIFQRCETPTSIDAWARIPQHHRFQRAYIENCGRDIASALAARCHGLSVEVQDWPQDYHYDIDEIGPSLFPVFAAEGRTRWAIRNLNNVYFDGPEWQAGMDWTGRFRRQNEIFSQLARWKKEEEHDRQVHAP